jgi:hypothetical protein
MATKSWLDEVEWIEAEEGALASQPRPASWFDEIEWEDEEEVAVETAAPPPKPSWLDGVEWLEEETTKPVARRPLISPTAPTLETLGIDAIEEQGPDESFLRPLADPLLNIGAGINDVVKGFTDAFGADNAVSQNLAKNSEWYRSLLSAGAKEDAEEIGRIMQEAEGQGVLAEIGAGLKALTVAPIDLVSQGIGSLIPFIATAGVGKAVGLSKAGVAVLQGVQGGVVGGGIVKGEIYDAVKDQLINSGVGEEKAEKAAMEAQSYNGKNLDQIFLGVGLGVAASTTGADSAIRSLISRKVGKEAAEQVSEQAVQEVLRTGFVRGAAKSAAVEFATEGLQGGQEKLAANVAVGREGFDVDPMRGVVAQATLEGSIGALLAGGVGGVNAKVEQMDAREKVALRDAAKAAEEAKQSNASASAAAVEEQINQTLEETPDEKVARLQEEATAAAGIELEEEGVGVEPTVPVTPPVEPTPEGAAAPVEPVVTPEVAEPQPAVEVATGTKEEQDLRAAQERDRLAKEAVAGVRDLPEDSPEVVAAYTERTASRQNLVRAEVAARHPNSKNISREEEEFLAPLQALAPLRPTEEPLTEGKKWRKGEEVGYNENVGTITKAIPPEGQPNTLYRVVTREDYERILANGQIDSDMRLAITADEGINLTPKTSTATYYLPRGETGVVLAIDPTGLDLNFIQGDSYVRSFKPIPADRIVGRSDFIHKDAETGEYLLRPQDNAPVTNEPTSIVNYTKAAPTLEAAPAATPPAEVTPTPETPNLEPLRRVARAEQTEEDVSGLVGQGLVELYNGQPVITQAGLETLPEAERPRLNPEARKIQIDTGANEVVAEAIAKNLRIGVDQVGTGVRMPAGWTLVEDIYVPPAPQEVAAQPVQNPVITEYPKGDVDERFEGMTQVEQQGMARSQFSSIEEYRKAFDIWYAANKKRVDVDVAQNYTPDQYKGERLHRFNRAVNEWAARQEVVPAPEVRESRREDVRLNPLGYDITTVVEDINTGRTDGPLRAVNNVIKQSKELRDRIQREAARRQEPRARGKAAILDRLSRERASGRISEETAQALTDFINRIRDDAIGDTAFSIRKGGVSNFNFGETLVSFFLNQDQPATGARVGIHEFFHGLSRFLPDAEVEQMRQDYTKNLAEYLKKNPWFLAFVGRYSLTPEQFEEYKLFNPKEAETKLQQVKDRDGKIVKYQIKYDADNYRYIMLDEWIAEKMTDLVRSKQAVPDTFMGKIAKVIRDFLDLIKAKLGKDAYESFYQTITDPKQKLNLYRMSSVAEPFQIYQPQNFNYAEDVLDRIRYTRTERDPIITQAATDLKEGKIDRDEYQRIVDLRMPLTKFENIPVPASRSDIDRGLGNRTITRKDAAGTETQILKRDLAQNPESISEGTIVESRLDIPAYENENVWVVSMHKPRPNLQKGAAGEVIAYTPTAVLRNVEFGVTEPAAINIATGKPKSTIATMKGSYVPMTAQQAYDLANRGRSEGWVEIGMNPIRHSYFYDKDTQSPVVSAEEVVQVGGMVLAKNPVYGKRDDYRFMALGGEEAGRFPTFETTSPEAATLSTMAASMAKVDGASEGKPNPENKPTYKISEIASVWMDQGGDTRQLQDLISENTLLSPANAKKVANAIAKQYGLQQQLAEAAAPLAEIAPEAEGAPRKSSVTKLIEQTTGVRKPVVKLQVSESAALKKQIQLKAREARETRKARKEAAEDLAKSITDYVKANPIRGPINSRQAMSITKKALKLDVNNEAAVDRFEMYVERVIENANYDRDLADARALIKKAKTFAKAKGTQGNVKTTLDAIASISPTLLDNPFEFNLVVQRYLLGLAPVTAKQYAVMPDADVRRYLESLETQIKDNQEVLDRSKAQRILDKQAAYAEEKGIPLDEAISILNSEEFLNEKTIEKLEDLTKLLTSMAQEGQKDVKAYDETGATPKQKELISFMGKVNLDSLTNEQKKQYIRSANNLLANGATFGMEQFQSIALGQEAAMKAVKDKRLSAKLAAWISPIGGDKAIDTARRIALKTQSEADTFKNIFGRDAVGAFRNILGLNRLDLAQTASNNAKEQIANETGEYYKGLKKEYGEDATNFEAKGYAGVAGYLIQAEGNKTESESIAYRRRLMEQSVTELRKSDMQSDQQEAEFKERALAQLTGTSNADILSQLRAINPASYEQLMWWKDTMLPKWRDFLKEHDENFRNQANNYNNRDHLTITYKFPEGQLLPNEIEDVYQQDAIGMRIKQAANSIKRKEHANLPVSPRSGTVANIDINFGYNQYNALVDQVDKAHVAPAWEQVVAFTKTPEFEQIMGGRANALFVKKMLVDIQTSRTRQSMSDDDAQVVAGGVRLARKMSTQAVLGGFTQPLRQVPDQLSKLFFTTGRFDLITKNLLKIAEASPLMNKFPIGRRGDAQAGTQYASQFSELARKVEASVTDRKWAKYRELMNKVGEFWMTPLRGSDVWAAKVSWMTYYEAYLNKEDIKMENWEREAELVDTDQTRKDAASYAEWAVDFYGGASDPTKMASLSKQTNNGWKEFAKLLFLPLNSFALQQKNSLISDMRDIFLRTGDRKASIAAVAGTLAGMAAFHATRIYIIGGLVYPAGKALLMGIFGIDMDEPDEEEKQKKLEDNWRKFKASMYGNIIAGGAGEFAEKAAIDAVNRTAYLWDANINPDSLINDKGEIMSFRQYEKEVSPLYRFRSYGSSEYSFGLADVLTEQATHSLAETQQLLTTEEMERYTGNEQAYAAFATGVEWMYFFRLMDTDVKRIATDLKRQMDKGVEEREKEIKAIRSGR